MTNQKILKPLSNGKKRILSIAEAMAQIDAHPTPEHPPYLDLEWEVSAPLRGPEGLENFEAYSYNKSLERIREAGYERHPRPQEFLSLLRDHFEGKLTGEFGLDIVEFFIKLLTRENYAGWLNMAWERKDNTLVCYMDPENLRFQHNTGYVIDGGELKFSYRHDFNILPTDSAHLSNLDESCEGLIKFLYGTTYRGLPEELQKTRLILPSESGVRPVSHVRYSVVGENWFKLEGPDGSLIGATPGVRKKK